jgi:hypothetical protein
MTVTNASDGDTRPGGRGERRLISGSLEPVRLISGSYVNVRFGRTGKQLARVHCDYGGYAIVHKWRENGRRWTDKLQVPARDILGPAPDTKARERAEEAWAARCAVAQKGGA